MKTIKMFLAILFSIALASCGGGEGGGATSSSNIVSGVASKGLLNGSRVCAYAISGGAKGAQIACSNTDATGNYNINLGQYADPVLFEAIGGSYTDEATGAIVDLLTPLHSLLANAAGGNTSVAITPLTDLAYQIANASAGGLASANIQAAITMVQNNFGVADIVNTMPVDALNVPAGATPAQRTYTLALAIISQYLHGQTAGISLADALRTMQLCLAAPTTSCGNADAKVGTLLYAAQSTFMANHPAFAGMALPLATFGSQPNSGTIILNLINPLPNATVGQAYAQTVVNGDPTPASRYTYSIDTLANGNGVPTGMTLDMNGILSGTPFATGRADVNGKQIPHLYTFGVCATDTISRLMTTPCPQTSITVDPATVRANLTITKAGSGSGTVTPSSPGIVCALATSTTECMSYTSGFTVTLTATPVSGSTFTGWSGGGCAGTGSCVVTMDSNKAVTATFGFLAEPSQPSLTLSLSALVTFERHDSEFPWLNYKDFVITFSGTASGPVSTAFTYGTGFYTNFSMDAWTGGSDGFAAFRAAGDPQSTQYSWQVYGFSKQLSELPYVFTRQVTITSPDGQQATVEASITLQ